MKKTLSAIIGVLIAALAASPSLASEYGSAAFGGGVEDGVPGVSGSVTAGGEVMSGNPDDAKFNEYWYRHEKDWAAFGGLDLSWAPSDGSHRMNFGFWYKSPEDFDVDLKSQAYGVYKFEAFYRRFGHVFAYNAETLHDGVGGNRLTINPAVKAAFNAAPFSGFANLNGRFDFLSHNVDIELRRDQIGAALQVPLWPLTFSLSGLYESREGTKPYGGTFGFGDSVEIAEPVDYDTYNAKAAVEYADKMFYAKAAYNHSTFSNSLQWVTYENPLLPVAAGNPQFGRNSLPPSNQYDSVSGTAAVNLPMHTRFLMSAYGAWLSQDEALLDPTINPALAITTPNPRGTADAEINKFNVEATVTSSPVERLHVKLKAKYYNHDNDTPVAVFQNIRADSALSGTSETQYVSWITRLVQAEAVYEIYHKTNVGLEYEYESESYKNGSSRKEKINTFKLFMDNRAADWLTARLTLEYQERNAQYPDYTAANAELPWMRKFYAADRNRYLAGLVATITPADPVSFTVEYNYGQDEYHDSLFGRRNSQFQNATGEMDLRLMDRLSMNAWYTFECYRIQQRSRQWNPGATGDPYSPTYAQPEDDPNNWTLTTKDYIHTVGLGADAAIIPGMLDFNAYAVYSNVDGDAFYQSVVGPIGAKLDNSAFVPRPFRHLDETRYWKVDAKTKYSITKAIGLTLGYRYENWEVDDYQYDGVNNVQTNRLGGFAGLINMNTLYRDYDVHTIYAAATYRF